MSATEWQCHSGPVEDGSELVLPMFFLKGILIAAFGISMIAPLHGAIIWDGGSSGRHGMVGSLGIRLRGGDDQGLRGFDGLFQQPTRSGQRSGPICMLSERYWNSLRCFHPPGMQMCTWQSMLSRLSDTRK